MKPRGNIFISTMFVVFITFVGISLLTFTILHTRIVRARTMKLAETDAIYQDLIAYLHHFRETLFNERITAFLEPEVEYFNSTHFPDFTLKGNRFISHSFQYEEIPQPYFKKTRITAAIDITSASAGRNNYRIDSEVSLDLLAGEIPLTAIPFFMNTGGGDTTDPPQPPNTDTFLKENNIVNRSDKKVIVDDVEVKLKNSDFLLKALKITGSNASWREIREKYGLPLSDEPIPQGFYLVVEDGVVESVFIQGDVERLIFAVENDVQVIRFIRDTIPYELRYKPGENYFASWDYSVGQEALFREKIIVNGSVWSVEQEGVGAFVPPTDITLLVAGKAVIRTNLETTADHFNWNQVQLSNLKLVCSKKDLEPVCDPEGPEAEVVVDVEGVDNEGKADLDLAIIVDGRLTNNNSQVKLSGSLYCKELENRGVIDIHYTDAAVSGDNPFSTVGFKYIDGFRINFIEEVYDDE
jgi:hypothetical protein